MKFIPERKGDKDIQTVQKSHLFYQYYYKIKHIEEIKSSLK